MHARCTKGGKLVNAAALKCRHVHLGCCTRCCTKSIFRSLADAAMAARLALTRGGRRSCWQVVTNYPATLGHSLRSYKTRPPEVRAETPMHRGRDGRAAMKRDAKVLLMLHERAKGRTQEQAAARAGMSVRTVRSYERRGKLPSELKQPSTYRSRPDPFGEDWSWVGRRARARPGHGKAFKAVAATQLLGVESYTGWYDGWVSDTPGYHPDLILPLANGPGLRSARSARRAHSGARDHITQLDERSSPSSC